jgi:hypothetical protein
MENSASDIGRQTEFAARCVTDPSNVTEASGLMASGVLVFTVASSPLSSSLVAAQIRVPEGMMEFFGMHTMPSRMQ